MGHLNKVHFKGQKAGEEILLIVRRHWFNIARQFIYLFFVFALIALAFVYFPNLFPYLTTTDGYLFFLLLLNFLVLLVWITSFIVWIDYYFDVWIITTKRIVNIEQRGLFVRHVSELEHENIQDITTEVKGFIPTLLNYGEVFIQTAAEKERFLFHSVPRPYHIKDLVMNLQKIQETEEAEKLGEIIRGEKKKDKDF